MDEGTHFDVLVTKFDESDKVILDHSGWKLSDELTLVTLITPKVYSAMSTFDVPKYDLEERGDINVTHTSIAMCWFFAKCKWTDERCDIPDMLDVTTVDIDDLITEDFDVGWRTENRR